MASKNTCKNSPKTFYTGKEQSPLGLGFCADAEKVGVKMTGKDKNVWVVGLKKGNKLWIRSKEEPKTPEPEAQSEVEDSDKEDEPEKEDSDKEDSDKEDEPEPETKKPKAKPKKEDKPKPKPKKEETTDSDTEETKPAPKAKKEPKSAIDKVLETHGIHGKAAEDIKALFAKKAKKVKDNEDKPKRAPSTYNKYVKVRIPQLRAEMQDENPELKNKDYMRLAAGEWKNMSDEEKAAFE